MATFVLIPIVITLTISLVLIASQKPDAPPFLRIAGTADEAFIMDEDEPALSAVTDKGRYVLVEGVGHLNIVNAPVTAEVIEGFLNDS